jgi:hypothetical protein
VHSTAVARRQSGAENSTVTVCVPSVGGVTPGVASLPVIESYNQIAIGGILMRDWIGQAMRAPDTVVDEVATGTIGRLPGVDPFPCVVSSPSGAFLD